MDGNMFEDEIPVGKAEDLRGKTFGRLKVLYRVNNVGKMTSWKCECQCNKKNILIVSAAHLKDGHTKSCGCLQQESVIRLNQERNAHLEGKIFGRLTVLEKTEERRNDDIVWKCLCECGEICYKVTSVLTRGSTQSCGCLRSEVSAEHFRKLGRSRNANLINKQFGKLTVLEKTDRRIRGNIVWKCLCDCGNICFYPTSYLTSGDTNSCGCLSSKGELKITVLLNNANIKFEPQKTFANCTYPDTLGKPRFDFYVINEQNDYLIEYDGIQHYKATNYGWNTNDNLIYTQQHDAFKNQWCRENNIPLIRIPYWKLDTLCIEDLMLETTKFRVV
jgi:hypothetical protein